MSCVIGHICVVALFWKPKLSRLFMYASCFIWILVACYLANLAYSFQVCNTVQNKNFIFSGFNAFLEKMAESKMFLLKLKLSECAICVLMLGRAKIQILAQILVILPGFCCFCLFSQAKAGITSFSCHDS